MWMIPWVNFGGEHSISIGSCAGEPPRDPGQVWDLFLGLQVVDCQRNAIAGVCMTIDHNGDCNGDNMMVIWWGGNGDCNTDT